MTKKFILVCLMMVAVAGHCFSQTFNQARLDSLFNILAAKDKFMGSIAVSKNGRLLYTKAIGYSDIATSKKANINTKYGIGSISKMFTAALVLKATEENKISLSETLNKYFPEIKNADKITIGNMLNHRSGIHNFTNDPDYLTYHTKAISEKDMIAIIAKAKPDFPPDSTGGYSNSNYVILSYILEKIYHTPYTNILNTKIIKPIGLKNTYFGGKTNLQNNESYSYKYEDKWVKEAETDPSIPMGAGALVSTPTDLTIFIEQLFAGKIISEKSLTLMKTPTERFGMGMFEFPYFEKKSYGHTGGIDGFQSVLTYFPDEKLSIALTSNGLVYANNNVLLCALSCYFNKPFEIPTFKSVSLTAADLDLFLGNYTSTEIPLKITISRKENKLFAQATGQASFPLEATSANTFQFEQAGIVLEFNADKKQMTLKQGGKEYPYTKE
jgi:D-alanyl-D-alanine carboxypeptidase